MPSPCIGYTYRTRSPHVIPCPHWGGSEIPLGRIDETRRVSRLLDIAWRIAAAPRHWTRRRLAGLYEVSERQITSDLTVMRHGLHWQVRTCHSGYYFDPLPSIPGIRFTLPEALALLLAVRAGAAIPGVGSVDLSAAIARLSSLLPTGLQPLAILPNLPASPREQTLRALQLALGQRQRIHIAYRAASSDGAITERDIDPYAVYPYGRSWHCHAYCHLRRTMRDFKADRILAVSLTPITYTIPPDFDLADYLGQGWGLMRNTGDSEAEVVLRFTPRAGRWVREERWHASQRVEDEPDGHVRFTVRTPLTPEFRRWVFHYGQEVEVLAPASLRAWVRVEAESVAARYSAAINIGDDL
jgi:predicted DNA-binding transcriptional regulator YafY